MTRWEYLFEHISSAASLKAGYGDLANRLGNEGWELVIMAEDGSMVFRRPKTEIAVTVGPPEHKTEAPSEAPSV